MAGEKHCRKGSGTAGQKQLSVGQQCVPWHPEGKQHPGVHQTRHHQQIKSGDHHTVFSISGAPPKVLHAVLGCPV